MKKPLIAIFLGLSFLAACETVPYETRSQNYLSELKTRFIGKNSDEVIIALGPPTSRAALSDGGEVLQYDNRAIPKSELVRGSVNIGYGRYPYYFGYGYSGYEFPYIWDSYSKPDAQKCVNRFVVDNNHIVKDVLFEGKDCFN